MDYSPLTVALFVSTMFLYVMLYIRGKGDNKTKLNVKVLTFGAATAVLVLFTLKWII